MFNFYKHWFVFVTAKQYWNHTFFITGLYYELKVFKTDYTKH